MPPAHRDTQAIKRCSTNLTKLGRAAIDPLLPFGASAVSAPSHHLPPLLPCSRHLTIRWITECRMDAEQKGKRQPMAKHDHPALLPPGLHRLTLLELHKLAVAPFPEGTRRHLLFDKLATWTAAVNSLNVRGTLWLDGSFLTQKPDPDDIDCVLWNPHWAQTSAPTQAHRQMLQRLFDQPTARAIYGLDFYLELPQSDETFHREAYWRGVLGFAHDRITAKGFAELSL